MITVRAYKGTGTCVLVIASCTIRTKGKTKAPTPPSLWPTAWTLCHLPTLTSGNPLAKHKKYGNRVIANGAAERTARFPNGMVRSKMDRRSVADAPAPTSRLASSFLRAASGSGNEVLSKPSIALEAALRGCRRHRKRLGHAIILERLEGGGCSSWRGCDCSGPGVGLDDKGDLCLCAGAKEMGKKLPDLRSFDWEAKRPDGKETGDEPNAAHDDAATAN